MKTLLFTFALFILAIGVMATPLPNTTKPPQGSYDVRARHGYLSTNPDGTYNVNFHWRNVFNVLANSVGRSCTPPVQQDAGITFSATNHCYIATQAAMDTFLQMRIARAKLQATKQP